MCWKSFSKAIYNVFGLLDMLLHLLWFIPNAGLTGQTLSSTAQILFLFLHFVGYILFILQSPISSSFSSHPFNLVIIILHFYFGRMYAKTFIRILIFTVIIIKVSGLSLSPLSSLRAADILFFFMSSFWRLPIRVRGLSSWEL